MILFAVFFSNLLGLFTKRIQYLIALLSRWLHKATFLCRVAIVDFTYLICCIGNRRI